ncbi:MAG: hypothetical protein AAF206_12090 [Bacteroidota bacterium]
MELGRGEGRPVFTGKMKWAAFLKTSLYAAFSAATISAWSGPIAVLIGDKIQWEREKSIGLLISDPMESLLFGLPTSFVLSTAYAIVVMIPIAGLFRQSFRRHAAIYIFGQMYGFHLAVVVGFPWVLFQEHFGHPTFHTFFFASVFNFHLVLWTFTVRLRHRSI